MKLLAKTAVRSLLALSLLAPAITFAAPITYNILDGSSGSFSGSSLHSATSNASGGYWMNGNQASVSGSLIIDWDTGAASGSISTDAADTDFGEGSGSWELVVTGGSTVGTGVFVDGSDLLLSLDYELFLNGAVSAHDTGTFFFADKTFAGSANSASASEIFLWGNNWLNANGAIDKTNHEAGGGIALGIDLYGVGTSTVPEPASLFLLGAGLFGMSLRRRRKAA